MLTQPARHISLLLAFDLLVLTVCGLGVYRVSEKAGFPTMIDEQGSSVVIRSASGIGPGALSLKSDDTLVAINGEHVASAAEIEFLCDQYSIGRTVEAVILRNGQEISIPISLVRDYSRSKIIVESFAALIFFLTGIAVVLLQKKETDARIFHHLSMAIAALILLTTGRFTISPFGLGYALEVLFLLVYVLVPVLFLHFTFIFPRDTFRKNGKILVPLYFIAGMLGLWSSITFLRAAYPSIGLEYYAAYGAANYALLLFFVTSFLVGFANLLHSYRTATGEFERRTLRWIVFGTLFGSSAYLILSVLPKLFTGRVLSEQYAILPSALAPLSFAIAIIRFKVFDIDLFFKRSTVYTLVIIALLGVYLAIVALFTHVILVVGLPSALPNIIGAIFIALLFDPLRRVVQRIVDKKFFRVSYNFHEAQRGVIEKIKFVNTRQSLADLVVEGIESLIPVAKIGFFTVETPSDRLRLLAHRNFDLLERRNIQLQKQDLRTQLELPVALRENMEPGIEFELADSGVFARWGMALVLPMLSPTRNILGFLVLGEKRSGTRFFIEDISLLSSVSTQAGLALERLNVEYALMIEQAESERLAELSRLKSYFVSSVSHDLKTPLTSIRLFAELMKDDEDLPRQKAIEYLSIIEGESDRLSRLITNVLDFAKIERGTKEYAFKNHNLNEIARDVIRSLDYQITSHGFELHELIFLDPLIIHADYNAVFDAITNLISNAMKYSPPERKRMTIGTESDDEFAILTVKDEGYGIAQHEIEHIFESFYRIDDSKTKSAGGAGIGLSIVKHTMDAHRGKVEVKSELGKGSIFALYFPLQKSDHPKISP